MIRLCTDKNIIFTYLNSIDHSVYLKEIVRLYLNAYGTDFEFCQFYVQFSDDSIVKSIVLRYNNQVYVISDECNDELLCFLRGYNDCTVFLCGDLCDSFIGDICYVMQKNGSGTSVFQDDFKSIYSAKEITSLVAKDYDSTRYEDFFLNTSHQLRHKLISVTGLYSGDKLSSVVSYAVDEGEYSLITFVYTDEYFRGKGLAKKILDYVCVNSNKKYILLCEKHNVEFYKKCGFEQCDICLKSEL